MARKKLPKLTAYELETVQMAQGGGDTLDTFAEDRDPPKRRRAYSSALGKIAKAGKLRRMPYNHGYGPNPTPGVGM